ncbi:hypothetical protein DH09_17485 [Bacillaceae bacterium JMAK1]|nr:hypothetical protein DH09_17485 [Bacillaceae bacterium JMAK1]
MKLNVLPMSKREASVIMNWTYEPPYSLYSLRKSKEQQDELLNGNYYVVLTAEDEVFGFYCYGESAKVPGGKREGCYNDQRPVDIGLGMNPVYTGQGYGLQFFELGLSVGNDMYAPEFFRLSVARWNQRAVTLYKKFGFKTETTFMNYGETDVEFLLMTNKGDSPPLR